jgi:CheY-like chemotaxis protein
MPEAEKTSEDGPNNRDRIRMGGVESLRPGGVIPKPERVPENRIGPTRVRGGSGRGDAAAASGVRALILVVERNPAVQKLESFLLQEAGFGVEFANDGQEALDRARTNRPYLLVTEILVPKVDGLTLCRRLREDPATRDIHVVVFSHLDAEDRAIEAGADAFLRKPFDPDRLVEVVRGLIDAGRRAG